MTLPLIAVGHNDLRGRTVETLCYPQRSLVLLGGIPGAGKSTLLNRLYGLNGTETATARTAEGVYVIDSQQSRNRLTPLLRHIPYVCWRWVVHVLHYVRIIAALRTGDPVVVHETGTRRLVRLLLGTYCRLVGAQAHVVLIDVDPADARRGQVHRGRMVTSRSFRSHARRWARLIDACALGAGRVLPWAASLTILDRPRAHRLTGIWFTSGAARVPLVGMRTRMFVVICVTAAAVLLL
ncbi:AAA family ATPase [Salinactinospora qingdaonensis]|uniref:AAA family ATPase n=1 Tax=Salinactinospora qingdaonensis TaxID=702744 RepID=A0ABP7FH52_9ACTN